MNRQNRVSFGLARTLLACYEGSSLLIQHEAYTLCFVSGTQKEACERTLPLSGQMEALHIIPTRLGNH